MPPVRSARIASSKPSCITYNRYDSHGKKISTATPSSCDPSISTITFTELANYFTTAHDQLYDILGDDVALRRIVHAIEVLTTSNRAMEAIRRRQEQFMMSQFRLALQQGLHGRLAPLVKQQRILDRSPTPFHHWQYYPIEDDDKSNNSYRSLNTADRDYLAENEEKVAEWRSAVADWSTEGINEWNRSAAIDWEEKVVDEYVAPSPPTWSEPKDDYRMTDELKEAVATLEERLSSPPLTYVFNNPTLDPPPIIPTCGICGTDDDLTPDCASYVCFHCEVTQSGHYPADCPAHKTYYDADD